MKSFRKTWIISLICSIAMMIFGSCANYGKKSDTSNAIKELIIDNELQKLGKELIDGQKGHIVAIEPSTGEVLCMVSDESDSIPNECIMNQYHPGDVFIIAQQLVLISEGFLEPQTINSYNVKQGFLDMMANTKYGSVENAFGKWHEYIASLGFGNKLGINLPKEKRGIIPNALFFNKAYNGQWNGETILNNAIGQGEVYVTTLQLANFSAIIANRGHYYLPHVTKAMESGDMDDKYKSIHSTIITQEAYDTVIKKMHMSALNGTCKALSGLPFNACGFTGKALQKGNMLSVFVGFAPVENPVIAVAVMVGNDNKDDKMDVTIGRRIMEKYLGTTLK